MQRQHRFCWSGHIAIASLSLTFETNVPAIAYQYCEQIDVGEETGPREIASGLRDHYTLEEMSDREVLVVCNLKAANLVGFKSNGMVLAAKVGDDVAYQRNELHMPTLT